MRTDKMVFAAFASASTTNSGVGAWMHPATELDVLDVGYYVDMARTLERQGFHLLFFDDRLAMPAVYRDDPGIAARLGSRALKLDLLTILAAISAHTSRIGLGATYSTTYYEPYHVARAFATLDHLSGGRAVWNIVTSLNANEAENFGRTYLDPETRYDRADEFLEIVTRLWESWGPDAVKLDRRSGIFADAEIVREIDYRGKFLSCRGPLTVPRPPQGWPVLLQAGQSGRGLRFAGRWADLTFTAPHDFDGARHHYQAQQQATRAAGRDPSTVRILPAVQPIVAETDSIAREKAQFFDEMINLDEALIVLSEQANVDLSKFGLDEPLSDRLLEQTTGARGILEKFVHLARQVYGKDATVRDLAMIQATRTVVRFVGSPTTVADQMSDWFTSQVCDGFAIVPADVPGSFEEFGRMVFPELENRGLVERNPVGSTSRERLGLPGRDAR